MNTPFVYEVFEKTAEKHPNKTALIYLGERYTFAKIKVLAERLAASLSELGVKRGDRAVIYLPHTPQWVITWLSLIRPVSYTHLTLPTTERV